MDLPKYNLYQQVIVKDGTGSEALIITGVKQEVLTGPFRYESQDNTTTRFFSDSDVLAYFEPSSSEWVKAA